MYIILKLSRLFFSYFFFKIFTDIFTHSNSASQQWGHEFLEYLHFVNMGFISFQTFVDDKNSYLIVTFIFIFLIISKDKQLSIY